MASIDGLFEQIIHYEKTAQERKNFLQELRQAVISAQENRRLLETKYAELQNKLAQKVGELSDKELMCKWLSSQETIYQQQLSDLEKQLQGLEEEKKSVKKNLQDEKEKFCANISQFYINFGPRSSCSKEREGKFSSMFQDLLMEREKYQSNQEKYSVREESVKKLCTEKENLKTQLEKIFLENNKLTSSLCEELQKSTDLEEEKLTVTKIPTTDPEFIRIQEELESERQVSSDLEQQYSHVQSQLHQLHQKLWQQQLRQQQQAKQTYTQTVNSHLVQDGNKTQSGQPIAWQQRRNMENDGQTRQQKSDPLKKTMKVLAQNSGSTAGGQIKKTGLAVSSYNDKNSQQNSDTGSGLEDHSDVLFSGDENLSDDMQLSQDDTM